VIGPSKSAFIGVYLRFLVRQAKLDDSCQLKGTDHGNCSFAM
jgi:hypothetical protein